MTEVMGDKSPRNRSDVSVRSGETGQDSGSRVAQSNFRSYALILYTKYTIKCSHMQLIDPIQSEFTLIPAKSWVSCKYMLAFWSTRHSSRERWQGGEKLEGNIYIEGFV
jgi:hypothetical protein